MFVSLLTLELTMCLLGSGMDIENLFGNRAVAWILVCQPPVE